MTNSFYGVVYRGGIALPMGVENISFLMQRNADIEFLERFLMYKAYHEPNFIECVPTNRFFAVIIDGYVGIYTSVDSVSEFLAYFHPTLLKEFTNVDDALSHVNWFYLRRIFPLIAYITAPIQYLKSIPLDTAVPVNFLGSSSQNNFPAGL